MTEPLYPFPCEQIAWQLSVLQWYPEALVEVGDSRGSVISGAAHGAEGTSTQAHLAVAAQLCLIGRA